MKRKETRQDKQRKKKERVKKERKNRNATGQRRKKEKETRQGKERKKKKRAVVNYNSLHFLTFVYVGWKNGPFIRADFLFVTAWILQRVKL